ncbi:aminoglycoside phosphotransferase family protein [Streptomyces sp. ISID311]|uniref:aminoglycoside phosphotransferase family protein n=1 Tax=Streptomyces sp. ISID311 TaxID=2601673 RepID=UPI0011BD3F3A|nr:aminoglycoside phosphotransferase family protein [Streptomyces sp. ISID311]TXC93946.1 phosphotransferase [Streptomyces sp. ISID311]
MTRAADRADGGRSLAARAARPRRPLSQGGSATDLIAETLGDLTPEWFTRVLRAGGTIGPETAVRSVDAQQIGTGQLGSVTRVTLAYDGVADAPATLVVKQPSLDAGSRQVGVTMGVYRSEVRFYEQIAPLVGLHTPAVHWQALEEDTGRFTIVLDDLAPTSDAGDMMSGATAGQASLAIRELVNLQAPLWDAPRLYRLPWLGDLGSMRMLFGAVPGAVDEFTKRFGDQLEPRHMALVETLAPRAPQAFEAVWKPPFVVAHCDYRLDNMLFGTVPTAPALTVVDWQTTCLGPPGLDAAVFLASSVDTETRRTIERSLLDSYVDGLKEAGVRDFGPADAWESYRAAALSPFLLTVFTSVTLEQTERGDAMWTRLLRGAAELVSDTEAARLLD